MAIKSIYQAKNLKNKCVLVRVDFNVPIKNGTVVDTFKIQKSVPTIKYLLNKGAHIVLVSHLGRPTKFDKKLSLRPLVRPLQKLLGIEVCFSDVAHFDNSQYCRVTLLENIRFYPGEEKNDPKFAKQLAGCADIFVLDGFAVAHRESASVSGVTKFLPTYAGLLLAAEIAGLSKIIDKPKKPFVVVLGGAKMETKIPVLKNLLSQADHILVGGGIANTYWWAKGKKIGDSLIDKDYKKEALLYGGNKKIILPVDVIVGPANGKKAKAVATDKLSLKPGLGIYDVGPRTIHLFAQYIKGANTVVWNGALGRFEQKPYQYGTYSVARLMAARAKGKAFGVCGGGETVEVLQKLHLMDDVDLVSTGGGAMLEFLSGAKLPGLKIFHK
ncbi:MAG: phosphoglycerate kinase [Candidatus Magasanikbacteria bacterium RIFOXYA2_FULL_44_8]|uniref:Phosphoglycerate kinase n=1 Tax=Candidatus Magasanikbacteria bacterium RIFOXYA2_FULL_44_8 TaxID=1798696 RepID=A0A1F6NI10_9BACT|nr:MAG: phosphoglycerate kinase [Candidatus Magasanikbacteria bacterium RIFOXYA2_FULL_44_8]